MQPGSTDKLESWELNHAPNACEDSGPTGIPIEGFQRSIQAQIGPPLLVDGVTYKQVVYIAPCDGCYLKAGKAASAVAGAGGTNTFALSAVDAGGGAARNQLSAATIDPTSYFTILETDLPLSTTYSDRVLDEGDMLVATYVTGTQSINGEGNAIQLTIIEPAIL